MMRQVSEIIPGKLYLGNLFAALKKPILLENNITHIVNVTDEIANHHPTTFTYHNIKIKDIEEYTEQLKQSLPDALAFIDGAISKGSVVFVHCKQGVSRSATVVLSYLIKYEQMTLHDAFWHVKQTRPEIKPNESFLQLLMKFELECHPQLTSNTMVLRDMNIVELHDRYPNVQLNIIKEILEKHDWSLKVARLEVYEIHQKQML